MADSIVRPDWQWRVIEEFDAVNEKLLSLRTFMGGDVFKTLDSREQHRLTTQSEIMQRYTAILNERIHAFS